MADSILTDDQLRIEAVRQLNILDTQAEHEFDEVIRFVAELCETPYVVMTLVDTERLWFKSKIGLDVCEIDREISMCNHTIKSEEKIEVEDTRLDPTFKDNVLVTDAPYIRFYNGLPLKTNNNITVGTLCVMDVKPRILSDTQKNGMGLMAKQLVQLLENRKNQIHAEKEAIRTQNLAEKFSSLYNSIEDGVVECTIPEGRFLDCNTAFCNMVGYDRDTLHTMTLYDLTPQHLHSQSESRINGVLTSKSETDTFEETYIHQSGRLIPIQIKIFKIKADSDNTSGIWAQIKDLSQQKKREEQRAQRKKMESLGTLSGGIAHDFNNILAIISGSAELIRMENNSANIENYVGKICDSSRRGADLVNRILAFSHKNLKQPKPIDLKVAVEQSLNLIKPTIPATIDFNVYLNETGIINADESNITQILMNLCSNARQAIEPDQGKITVTLSKSAHTSGDMMELTVKDDGIGMSTEQLVQVFDPFYTTKEKGRGTGLGMAIVHGLVEDMNGIITVDSQRGNGTLFNIKFPITQLQKVTRQEKPAPTASHGHNILIVEDEKDIAQLYKEALVAEGHTVSVRHDGQMGLEQIEQCLNDEELPMFDLVVTDDQMPRLRGVDLAKKLRALVPGIRILLLTGFISRYVEQALENKDIDLYLAKPVSLKGLRLTVDKMLSKNS